MSVKHYVQWLLTEFQLHVEYNSRKLDAGAPREDSVTDVSKMPCLYIPSKIL
jgi:hypothetical protein